MINAMEDYSREMHRKHHYSFVQTPHITKGGLYETSGHLHWYKDGMYPAMRLDEEKDENGNVVKQGFDYYLKPMNCPMHNLIFKSRQRSYRELPLRLFEFGTVYRYEKSGEVHGLTRVRGLTQDDSHIYCTREQMKDELKNLLTFVLGLLKDFGLDDFYLELSARIRTSTSAPTKSGKRPPIRWLKSPRNPDLNWLTIHAAQPSMVRRSPCRLAMPSAVRGRCPPSSLTSTFRNVSAWSTSLPMAPTSVR